MRGVKKTLNKSGISRERRGKQASFKALDIDLNLKVQKEPAPKCLYQ